MEKKPEWTWLKELVIDPEFGHFTKTAKTRALKALMYAGKLDDVGSFLLAWHDSKVAVERYSCRVNPVTDKRIAFHLVYCYPRGSSNPYEGDKVNAYVEALFHTIQKRNPALVAKYMRGVDKPMKMYQVAYVVNNDGVGTNMSEVYYGFDSVFDVMHALSDKYGYYPLVLNVYSETLPTDVTDTLRFLYGFKQGSYPAKEWYENFDEAKKILENSNGKEKR